MLQPGFHDINQSVAAVVPFFPDGGTIRHYTYYVFKPGALGPRSRCDLIWHVVFVSECAHLLNLLQHKVAKQQQ